MTILERINFSAALKLIFVQSAEANQPAVIPAGVSLIYGWNKNTRISDNILSKYEVRMLVQRISIIMECFILNCLKILRRNNKLVILVSNLLFLLYVRILNVNFYWIIIF